VNLPSIAFRLRIQGAPQISAYSRLLNAYLRPFDDQPGTRNGSKIERFHKTLRAERLTGRRFDALHHAQQVLNAWVTDYNTQRTHQVIAM
jgi:transposase InsO family protein